MTISKHQWHLLLGFAIAVVLLAALAAWVLAQDAAVPMSYLGMPPWLQGLVALAAIVAPIIGTVLLAMINKKQSDAANKVEAVRTDLASSVGGVSSQLTEIHTAVNSERSAMIEELRRMNSEHATELKAMHATIATLTQDKRDLQDAALKGQPQET